MTAKPDERGSETTSGEQIPAWLPRVIPALAAIHLLNIYWSTRTFVMDDAFTGLRYVRHLLDGRGFVFNLGERVEGVTNTGWLLLLAALGRLGDLPAVARITGLILCIAAASMAYDLVLRIRGDERGWLTHGVPVLMLTITWYDFVYFSIAGMETALVAVLLAGMVYAAGTRGGQWWVPVLGAAAFLVRPEAVLVVPIWLVVATCARFASRRALGLQAVIFLALLAGIALVRSAQFGMVLPNTFYAKPTGPTDALVSAWSALAGLKPNLPILLRGFVPLLVMAYGATALWRRSPERAAMVSAVVATGWLFAAYALNDWTESGRYFGPYLPLAAILLWTGLRASAVSSIERVASHERAERIAAALIVVLVGVTGFDLMWKTGPQYAHRFPGYVATCVTLREPCAWMRDHLPADATIATRRIGALGYITDRRIFDYTYGLTDRRVARLVRRAGHQFEDPNDPALAELWREERPDYLIEDLEVLLPIVWAAGGTLARFEVHGIAYREVRRFPLGEDAWWVLCARADVPEPSG